MTNQTEWKMEMSNPGTNSRKWVISVFSMFFVCAAVMFGFPNVSAFGMPLGEKTWEQWKAEAGWSSYSADSFQPPAAKIEDISKLSKQKTATFVIVGGSWCSDTEMHLPRIMKILSLASIPPGDIHLYGVDRRKKEPSGKVKHWHISRIPTVIILSKGKEMGRIVENPKVSWEDDIAHILSR